MRFSLLQHLTFGFMPARALQPASRWRSPAALASIAAAICLCIGLSAASLHAQGYGTISGVVTDPAAPLFRVQS